MIMGDDPQMDFLRSPLSPGDMGVLLSIPVAPMSNTSQRRGSVGNGHSPGMDSMTVMGFPRKNSTQGEMCAVELDSMTDMGFPGRLLPWARCARLNWTFPGRAFRRAWKNGPI